MIRRFFFLFFSLIAFRSLAQTHPNTGDSIHLSTCRLAGDSLNLPELSKGYVLMEFWASWCAPCRFRNREIENYRKARLLLDSGEIKLSFIGVSLDTSLGIWQKALTNDKLKWDAQLCDTLRFKGCVNQRWGITYLPFNFLINPEGIVIGQGLSIREIEEILEAEQSKKE